MARKTVLIDDFDGKELPSDTAPVRLSIGNTTYRLYLSEKSQDALQTALEPFIKDAEKDAKQNSVNKTSASRGRTKAIREWAQANNITFNGKPLGDRGRIPEEIVEQYEKSKA